MPYSYFIGRQPAADRQPYPSRFMATVITDNGRSYHCPDHLLLFGQINLAKCAAERAADAACDSARFGREYDTAKLWSAHGLINRW